MIAALALSVALSAASPQTLPSPLSSSQQPTAAPIPSEEPVRLEDVEVTGRPLESLIRSFVNEVAAPNSGRGVARWRDRLCVGTANLKPEAAQYIVDRVSTVAADLGLSPEGPGCKPHIIIIATNDGEAVARQLVQERGRAFRMGGGGMDRGGVALRDFLEAPRPVRWWQLSMPVDSENGQIATRLPGQCTGSCSETYEYAPILDIFAASRLSTQTVDDIFRAIVIVDMDEMTNVTLAQLADYIAMVTLAQILPTADTSSYASILNLFDAPASADGLTEWDRAYLEGLYDTVRTRKNPGAGRLEVAASIGRTHQRLQNEAAVGEEGKD